MSGGSDQIKNMIYINGNRRNHCFITAGITFEEFASNIPSPIHQVLLLKHNFEWADFHYHTLFEYVEEENMNKLITADIDEFHDFCWVDFDDVSDLDELEPKEIAELLYLAHKKEPLGRAFFPLLKNRFAYFSHDDGWYSKVYYRRMLDFVGMLSKVIPYKLGSFGKKRFSLFQKSKIYPAISKEVILELVPLMEDGLYFDLAGKIESRRGLDIPVYVIGSYESTDEVLDNLAELKRGASQTGWLIFDKKEQEWQWMMD
ncbi:oxalate:formate antiporter [Bacillus manliponensis]|uniref:Oxalate:formate antiporter n=1 Tax=Bacillus manliponensis TaxID=574376 RepID=A0A073K0L9_9BACI|nr:hypothetical protein [Bacillus manliponensis]KEK20040.1 oxalate:formate antiporter [Bacillus manliponensis]